MKELVQKFKEIIAEYDYQSQDSHVLLNLINILLSMMTITDYGDHHKIKKIASFLKILSSDFCQELLDEEVIEDIFDNSVVPILHSFEEKYSSPDTSNKKDDKYFNTEIGKLCSDIRNNNDDKQSKSQNKISFTDIDIDFTKLYPSQLKCNEENLEPDNKNKDDPNGQKLLDMLKKTSNELFNIYQKILNRSIDDTNIVIFSIRQIKSAVNVTLNHQMNSIKICSRLIDELCDYLIIFAQCDIYPGEISNFIIFEIFHTIERMEYDVMIF